MLTVFGFGEHRAVFRAALQDHSWAEQVGTTLQLNAGFPTEIGHLVCCANDLYRRSVALPFVPVMHRHVRKPRPNYLCQSLNRKLLYALIKKKIISITFIICSNNFFDQVPL